MKPLGNVGFSGWCVIASIVLAISTDAFSQGRPDIVWAKGGHSDSVNSVADSPDGRWLVSGSSDRTIKVWQPTELSFEAAFSADGSRFAYGRMDAVAAVATNPFPPKAKR